MTPSPSPPLPEFRGKTLTPVSPLPLHVPEPSNIPVLQKQMDPVFNTTTVHLDPRQAPSSNYGTADRQGDSSDDATGSTTSSRVDEGQAIGDTSNTSMKSSTNGIEASQIVVGNGLTSSAPVDGTQPGDNMADSSIQKPIDSNIEPQDSDAPEPVFDDQNGNDTLHSVLAGSIQSGKNTTSHISQLFQDTPASTLMTSTSTGGQNMHENVPSVETNGSNPHSLPSSKVDYQSLLDNLIQPSSASYPPINTTASGHESDSIYTNEPNITNIKSPSNNLPVNATLPPRPPPQEKPVGFISQDDPRSLHLQIAGSPAINASNSYSAQSFRVPPGLPAPVVAAGAPGTSSAASGLPPPPGATFQQLAQQTPSASNIQPKFEAVDRSSSLPIDQDEAPWGPETQKVYDQFLSDERVYVAEAQWEKFPADSRLFVGNLATESVTKRDLFHVFSKYGKLAQISIKQAFGFIQFFDAQPCRRALHAEQDTEIRGKRIHLELSKPQRSGNRRRSRSPDRGTNRDGNKGRASGGRDRGGRARDDYRPGRSPSPRSYGRRGDSYRGGGESDRGRFDARKRSRSRSPYGRSTRIRDRSPSPRHRDFDDDQDLLPRRAPGEVPEVQLIVLDDLDRNFLEYVNKGFKNRGIRTDILFLSPRLQLQAVLKRQIVEGVQAVVRLERQSQNSGKIPLQLYDRRGGTENVRFDEYEDLTPDIAAELVVRARQTHAAPITQPYGAPQPPGYGQPPYGQPFANIGSSQPQLPAGGGPNLSNLISSLDGQGLQKLLGALQQQPQHTLSHQAQPNVPPELAGLLASAGRPQQNPYQNQQPPPNQNNPYSPFAGNPAYPSMIDSAPRPQHHPVHHQQSPPQQPNNVNNIMDQLAKWRQS